jgi:uncharacterized protein
LDKILDGPEEEHDRFRVQKNGKGSWKKIMENIKYIKSKFPEYYDKYVTFLLTLHPQHDKKK